MKRTLCHLAGILIGLMLLPATAAELYKYTDDNGRVHYTDKPPVGQQTETLDIKVKSYRGTPQVTDYDAILSADDNDQAVTIYTTDWCHVCKKAKRYMDNNNIRYTEHDIEKDRQAKRDYQRLGGKGVPVIVVGEQTMHGFSARRLDALVAGQ